MNQDVLNQIKIYLNEFPKFLKDLLQNPMEYIDNDVYMDWLKLLLFGYIIEAATNTAYSIMILNFSGIAGSLIFSPIQTLVVIAFLSFIIWFILDRAGFSKLNYISIFKLLVFAEMLVSIAAVPILVVLAYLKSVDLIYIASALLILAKSYLVYRGFNKQFQLAERRALAIVGIITVILLAPVISGFFDGYSMRKNIRDSKKLQEIQMEESIEELEKELGGE